MKQANTFMVRYGTPLLLLLLTVVLYGQVIGFRLQYSWDDNRYIFENPFLRTFPSSLVDMFSRNYFGAYLPVTMVGYGIQFRLFGLDAQGGYFVVNMLLHAINGILVYRFLFRLTGNRAVGLIASVLFVVHPINVESVAWVSQLKSTLSMFFFLLAWLAHMESNDRRTGVVWLLVSYVWFAFSIMAKPTAVGAVVLFTLYDFWGSRLSFPRILIRNFIYAVIGVAGAVLIVVAHTQAEGIKAAWGATLGENIALQLHVISDYFFSLLNPSNLNNMYVYTSVGVLGDPISIVFGLLFLVGMIIFAIWQPLGRPFCAFAVAWVFVMMAPVSNIIPIAIQRADRYMYYPSIVIFMLVAMAVLLLWERFRAINQRYVLIGIGLAYVAILCFITFQRVGVWRNTQTLWEDHLTDYPNGESATGLLNLSVGYYNDNQLQDAFVTLTKLLQYYPDNYKGNRLLGLTYLRSEQYANAIVTLDRANTLGGEQSDIKDELGAAYFQEGLRQFESGEYANALALYSKALENVPEDNVPVILNNVGYTLQKAGQLDEAIQAFQAALQLDPNYARAYINMGETYLYQENYTGARDAYQQAVTLGVTLDAAAQSNLCLAKGEVQDDVAETVAVCQTALQEQPDNALFLGRAAHVLLLYGQNDAAQQVAERSVQIQPTSLGYRTLGDALARRGDTQRAIDAYRQALLLDPNNTKAQTGLTAMGATP